MKTIRIDYPVNYSLLPNEPIVLAMGFFDGVHKGHQRVIQTAKKVATEKNIKLGVMTFNQSPSTVYGSDSEEDFRYLSTINRKEELFNELGVDFMFIINFSKEFSTLQPQDFVDQYMIGLHADTVVAGFDYTYGKKAIANMDTLNQYSRNKFSIIKVSEVKDDENKIGTTSIKAAIKKGDFKKANNELGYIFENTGKVVHGLKRGRTLGFPTANVEVGAKEYIPGDGVYITQIKIDDKWYDSMTSVGFNITFDDVKQLSIETNILNFSESVYGKTVKLRWLSFLRKEVKFSGVDELIEQLKLDRINTENFFKTNK